MEITEFEKFEEDFNKSQEEVFNKRMKDIDDAWPLEERVLYMEQKKVEERNAKITKEAIKETQNLLPSFAERLANKADTPTFRVMSGFDKIDEIIQGFRGGNTYVVAGLEKSGKSSFLMNILDTLLHEGIKVGYINTELTDKEFADRLAAIHNRIPTAEAEEKPEYRDEWAKSVNEYFQYAGVESATDLKETDLLSFKMTMERMHEFVLNGAKVVMLDNLTTFNTLADSNKKGWEILAACITKVVTFAKTTGTVIFVVIHTKPNVVFSETAGGIKKMIEEDPHKILTEQVIVTRKPTLSDVYGGGTALSQLSGALLLWRPYQKFNDEGYKKITSIIMDSLRHGSSGKEVEMEFDGERGLFTEVQHELPY